MARLRHRALWTLALFVGVLAAAYALAAIDRCGDWPDASPSLRLSKRASGGLRAGTSTVPLVIPQALPVAGYGPIRPTLHDAHPALEARAVVLEEPGLRVGLVTLDALLIPPGVDEAVRLRSRDLGLDDVWLVATHTHSGFGGIDPRRVSELAGTGRFQPRARAALEDAAVTALATAVGRLEPADWAFAQSEVPDLIRARSGAQADRAVWLLRLTGAKRELARIVVIAAHPTLVGRSPSAFSPDWPGLLERADEPTLVLPGAIGNASAVVPPGEGEPDARYAAAVSRRLEAMTGQGHGPFELAVSAAVVALPRPDGTRLAGPLLRRVADNVLCDSADHTAVVRVLQLGPLRLVGVPGEVTYAAEQALLAKAPGARVVSLVGAYVGYVESEAAVREDSGEAKRQYFSADLVKRLADGVTTAVAALAH